MLTNKKYAHCILAFLLLISYILPLVTAHAQKISEKDKNKVMLEGLVLYTLILANWTSNDLYYENEYDTRNVNGYLSYRDKDTLKTIFWREIDTTSVEYKTKTFKSAGDTVPAEQSNKALELKWIMKTVRYNNVNVTKKNALIPEEEERVPNEEEKILIEYRNKVYKAIDSDTTFFKQYEGTKLRAVPIDAGKEIEVYVYSSLMKEGVLPIGGDYLLIYDKKTGKLVSREDLHQDCIFVSFQYRGKSSDLSKATVHTHKKGTSPLITPTDIATLLLYKSQLQWDEHHVISDKYTSIFSLVDRKLEVMLTKDFEALKAKRQEKDNEEKKTKMR